MIDAETLLPRIVDMEEFRRGLAHDPLRDGIEALWEGRPDDAEAILCRQQPTLRVRALLADCRRDRGELTRALSDYRQLVRESIDTAWEPVMRQHYGKVLFAAARFEEAAEQFALALSQREDAGADETLLASSRYALQVAERSVLASRGNQPTSAVSDVREKLP